MKSVKQNEGIQGKKKGNVAPFKKIPSSPDPKIERSCHFDPGCQAAVIGVQLTNSCDDREKEKQPWKSSYKRRGKKGQSGGEERDFIIFAGTFGYLAVYVHI
jgi:hypothetical protein